MKKITLLIGAVFVTTVSFSQVITRLVSVPCNTGLEGTYPFEYAGELDGTSTDWGLPNIFLGENSVQGPLEFVNDGTAGLVNDGNPPTNTNGIGAPPLVGVPKSALGCDTTNAATQDMTGKIAVVYRGACEFGLKAYNAQKRGAIACIIINHTGDAVGMAGGTYGTRDTIPVVQIGRVAGDDLYLAIQSCTPGSVIAFIGSKVALYNDDMGSTIADIVMPNELSIPSNIAVDGTNYPVDLGFFAFNYGTNGQTGVTATVNVVHEIDGNVYTNTSAPLNFVAPNLTTLIVDTQYFDLGTFAPAQWKQGAYTITYTLNLAGADEDPADNTFDVDFRVTANAFGKSRTTPGNEPIATTAFSLNETTTLYDNWEACIVFRSPVVTTFGGRATSLTFSAAPVGTLMEGEILEARIYEWNDVFVDMNSGTPAGADVTFTSLNQVGSGFYFYAAADADSLGNKVIDLVDDVTADPFVVLANNQRYLFCVYNASDSLRLGYDSRIDYLATINNYLQPVAPVRTLKNAGADEWFAAGFGYDVTPAFTVNIDFPTSVNAVSNASTTVAYPNPAVNMLNVPVRKGVTGKVTVEIFDLAGKLVISENKTIGNGPLKVNVASISNGAYVFNLTFADGSQDTFKVSVNR